MTIYSGIVCKEPYNLKKHKKRNHGKKSIDDPSPIRSRTYSENCGVKYDSTPHEP